VDDDCVAVSCLDEGGEEEGDEAIISGLCRVQEGRGDGQQKG